MVRSNWKLPYSKKDFLKKFFLNKNLNKPTLTYSRNFLILPAFVGNLFFVYDGKKLVMLQITSNMIGHKIGEFVSTKKKTLHKKK